MVSSDEIKANEKKLPAISYETAMTPDRALLGDYYRPTYHAVPSGNWMNEPHALFQYKGKWHLFYQFNPSGPYWHNISWGHWVSDDMVNWKFVKEAVIPTENTISPDGVWTGTVIFSSDGEPLLLITAGDDSRPVNGSNQHVGLVRAVDYNDEDLTEWDIIGYAAAQSAEMGTPGEFRDAQAFGIGDDRYMVVGGADNGRGVAHIFKTKARTVAEWEASCANGELNGMNWEYMGNIFGDFFEENEYLPEYGKVWEMPNIVPLNYEDGTGSDKYLFVFSPQHGDNDVWYYIGEFDTDTCRFRPDYEKAKLMDYGNNIFTGPTVYKNADGKVYICSVMQENAQGQAVVRTEKEHGDAGWAYYAGLPRELFLNKDGRTLGIKHIDTTKIEGDKLVGFEDLSIAEANKLLSKVSSDTVKMDFTVTGYADRFGFKLKRSGDGEADLYIAPNEIGLDSSKGEYVRKNTVSGTIYVDRCSIEAYIDNNIAISGTKFIRGTGIELYSTDDIKCSITVTAMNSIHKDADNNTNNDDKEDEDVKPIVKSYNIKYVLNGGKNDNANPKTYKKESTVSLKPAKRTGYTFEGWYTDSKFKTKITKLDGKAEKDVTVYAKWKLNSYSITYKLNSGKNDKKNPVKYTIESKKIVFKEPTRKGYTFKGWYTDSKYVHKVKEIKAGSTGNVKLYAKWSANKYTVKFAKNGAKAGKMKELNMTYGKSVKLQANKYTRKGYIFTGWNTKANGKGTKIANKASIKNLVSKNKGSITLYAQWKKSNKK